MKQTTDLNYILSWEEVKKSLGLKGDVTAVVYNVMEDTITIKTRV